MLIKFEGALEAISPIHHGGDEKTGSTPVLRYIMLWDVKQGREIQLPFIAGNAIRGKLRRLVMLDFLQRIGLSPDQIDKKLYHTLFAGGVLESSDEAEGYIDLTLRREIRAHLPPLSLFGASLRNQMVPSKLIVGNAFPVCAEYAAYLPPALQADPRASQPVRIFTDEMFHTRRDELRAERAEDEQAVQMKVDFEVFVPGTLFTHYFALQMPSEVEISCFAHMIELFRASPYIGGGAATGLGEVRILYDISHSAQQYLEFLQNNKEKACELLKMLATLVG